MKKGIWKGMAIGLAILLVFGIFGCAGTEKAEIKKSTETAKKAETKTEAEQADPWADEAIRKFYEDKATWAVNYEADPQKGNVEWLKQIFVGARYERALNYYQGIKDRGEKVEYDYDRVKIRKIYKKKAGVEEAIKDYSQIGEEMENDRLGGYELDKVAVVAVDFDGSCRTYNKKGEEIESLKEVVSVIDLLVLTDNGWRIFESYKRT